MQADPAKLDDKMLRTPKCSRCRNHGYLVPVKGHAGKYRWKQCICDKCYLISERQKIMAAQKMFKKQDTSEEQGAQLAPGGPREAADPGKAADPNPGEAADPDPEEAADPDPWEAANYDPGEAANPDPGEAANPISGLCTLPLASSGGPGPGPTTSSLERPPLVCSPGPNAFQPVLGNHPGPSTFQAALSESPPTWLPQLSSEAPRTEPCLPEQRLPLRLLPRLPFPNYGKCPWCPPPTVPPLVPPVPRLALPTVPTGPLHADSPASVPDQRWCIRKMSSPASFALRNLSQNRDLDVVAF